MAGMKGRSGGARPNSGPKRKKPVPVPFDAALPIDVSNVNLKPVIAPTKSITKRVASKVTAKVAVNAAVAPTAESRGPFQTLSPLHVDPLEFLRAVWTGHQDASPTQLRAAAAALPFVHKRLGENGKKEGRQAAAEKAASRFTPVAPPKSPTFN